MSMINLRTNEQHTKHSLLYTSNCNILVFEYTNLKKNTYIGFIRIKSSTLCLLPGV